MFNLILTLLSVFLTLLIIERAIYLGNLAWLGCALLKERVKVGKRRKAMKDLFSN